LENWDDIRVFLAVARQGGLTSAAQHLGINHTTVARRLTSLETSLHTRLVSRTPTGVTLTPAGQKFLHHAERIEHEALSAEQHVYSADGTVSGKVRLATREGVGAWLICPKVAELNRRYPDLKLELVSEARTISLLKRDADITISLQYPSQSRVIVQKLVDYRLGLFASPGYLEEFGPIDTVEELYRRDVIWYVDDFVDIAEQRYMQRIVANSRAGFRATNILAQYVALTSGMGVGIIPVYQAGQDPALVRVLPNDVEEMRTYWLSVHPDAQALPNVRAVIDFILDIIREKKNLF
jgi:DNA-binding transcriptional LysR family regulator